MRDQRDDRWESVPAWAFDIIELQLVNLSQNEAILAALEKRDNKLSPEDQAKVDSIFDVAGNIRKKVDAALKT